VIYNIVIKFKKNIIIKINLEKLRSNISKMGPKKGKKKTMIVTGSNLADKIGENFAMKLGAGENNGTSEDGWGDNNDTSLSQS
jgi:hypothetical protein